jgi:apolipoprotein N-acyltransferase
MKAFFAPNITGTGRVVRGIIALSLFVAAVLAFGKSIPLGLFLLASGVFVAFEALRGWCFLRACGIKTRL